MVSNECADLRETINIENVVASTDIGQELELMSLAMDLREADYDPENFPGVIYRTQNPHGSALIFRSGKIVSTGTSSIETAHAHLQYTLDALQTLGIDIPDEPEIGIGNVVASADLGVRLNLNAIAIGLGLETTEYEPEQFPGLVYRIDDPSVVVLLFSSGKTVITGASTREEVECAVEIVVSRLTKHRLL